MLEAKSRDDLQVLQIDVTSADYPDFITPLTLYV